MYILLLIGLLLVPADSLTSVEQCKQKTDIIEKISSCRVALIEVEGNDSLFYEVTFSDLKPALDTLVTLRDSVHTRLKQGGVMWAGRRFYDWKAAEIGYPLYRCLHKLRENPTSRGLQEDLIDHLDSLLALADRIQSRFPKDLEGV